jgi:hypothetical protein
MDGQVEITVVGIDRVGRCIQCVGTSDGGV